ncbi:MAG: flagellar biosynthesis anti-sigma factor FlgM [Planctomycetota bacterium]
MNINPVNPAVGTGNVNAANKATYARPAAQPQASVADKVEVGQSDGFQRLVAMAKEGEIRADKVADIKAQIAAGKYDLDAKADIVADRLLEDL